jgi:hypothetical protein
LAAEEARRKEEEKQRKKEKEKVSVDHGQAESALTDLSGEEGTS